MTKFKLIGAAALLWAAIATPGGLIGKPERDPGFPVASPGCKRRTMMKKFALLGAAAVLATPVMAQEATQEPGMIGFNYPNSQHMTGGYGVRTPYNTGRYPRMPYYRHVYYGPVGVVGGAVGTAAAIAAAPFVSVEDSYAYYEPY